ncbi:uncharacterized protein F5891DRAFT_1192470 [Suillus fuscotomentosus]|uniref:Uncharacterized protein n=1 Tax=Suillus fuscotomentosus TaxID=1912939 RepID=A0AAD4E0M6_9AGAM|nr:uncharacterized protein F5891DRAFT_1192470 [Suillus fuscotomentosus]KAG1897046.1 hypothetical protein F5891DRAFT_1192470 [Suillus fuscotomentosus]
MKDFGLDTKTKSDAAPVDEGSSRATVQSIDSGRYGRHKLKRSHLQYTLHEGGEEVGLPSKKARSLKTTWSQHCHGAPGTDSLNYLNERMLELSRITRRALATRLRYQRIRAHELQLIMSIHEDETELTQTELKDIDLQIGSIRNMLRDGGMVTIGDRGHEFDPGDDDDRKPWRASRSSDNESVRILTSGSDESCSELDE